MMDATDITDTSESSEELITPPGFVQPEKRAEYAFLRELIGRGLTYNEAHRYFSVVKDLHCSPSPVRLREYVAEGYGMTCGTWIWRYDRTFLDDKDPQPPRMRREQARLKRIELIAEKVRWI